ncbi:hypothetical protein [uncultured Brachyspira sp.]|uniref:hypothetical protein n=1 Tax=uncultured Brachyspira sp. TaxID=221953 RepID=UPI0025F7085F|nr:hypothetical protein [uncultured Brachyspira sp.]
MLIILRLFQEKVKMIMTDYSYHSLQIGILPKININQFSIDIDGGVKNTFISFCVLTIY